MAKKLPFKFVGNAPTKDTITADGYEIEIPNHGITAGEALQYNAVMARLLSQKGFELGKNDEGETVVISANPEAAAKMELDIATIALRRTSPDWTEADTLEAPYSLVTAISNWFTELKNAELNKPVGEGEETTEAIQKKAG